MIISNPPRSQFYTAVKPVKNENQKASDVSETTKNPTLTSSTDSPSVSQANSTPKVADSDVKEDAQETALTAGRHQITLQHSGYKGYKKGASISIETKAPIYLIKQAQFGKMKKSAPCLIMSESDFNMIKDVIHYGAFGSDYCKIPDEHFAVWKHPIDLMYIDQFNHTPVDLEVGSYIFVDDGNGGSSDAPIGLTATKLRFSRKVGQSVESIHHFRGITKVGEPFDLPGISTGFFFEDFKNPLEPEKEKVRAAINELKNLGIDAFLSNSAHHAIVVYGHNNQMLSPQSFAKLLHSEPGILKALSGALLGGQNLNAWQAMFIDVFGKN